LAFGLAKVQEMTKNRSDRDVDFDLTRPVVFVVEDDEDYRKSLCMVISAAGFQVSAFCSADDFIDNYQPEQPGCLILDLQTPGYDAVELYSVLVQKGGAHPFIVISAHGNVPKVASAMRNGAIDFLAKPVNHQILLERIGEAIAFDGARRVTAKAKEAVRSRLGLLTKREREVLELVSTGLASKQIAKRLDMGTNTVDVHRSNLMRKMGVSSSVELICTLTTHALLPGEDQAVNRDQ
jgi:two-component system response regulator TtrR